MRTIHRRRFLGSAVAGTVAGSLAGTVAGSAAAGAFRSVPAGPRAAPAGAPPAEPASRKIGLGLIGCGWYGMVDLQAALKAEGARKGEDVPKGGGLDVVALCDVDADHLQKSADEVEKLTGSRPRTFKLFQEMLDAPGLEAVIIATPPQWHALQFIAACEKGLDIYCEKPLAYDIREGRAMVDAARKAGRIVQIGFQRRQSPAFRAVRDLVKGGELGRIVQADVQIHYAAGMRDATPQDPPASLDWDLWCGPAPLKPYSPNIGHIAWRLEETTGHGHLVDWGIHLIDATRMILGEGMPRTVQAAGGTYVFKDAITTPDILTVHFDFETCPVTWRHRIWGAEEYAPETSNGIFLYGEKATVFAADDRWVLIPRGKGAERKERKVDPRIDMGLASVAEFLECVRTRATPSVSVEDAFRSTATVQLGAIAYKVGSRIRWDAERETIPDHPEAAGLLKREYRAPWKHPFAG